MYMMPDNRKASRFDLHFCGQLVASLRCRTNENGFLVTHCESTATVNAARPCRELMRGATNEALNHWTKVTLRCSLALRSLRDTPVFPP